MLVCNVSLRPLRTAIAATVAEATTAVDATATGNVVFATLVDDPASVGDLVDAYLGSIMLEAASAADSLSSGQAYADRVDEIAVAADTQDGTVIGAIVVRSRMVIGAAVNTGASRQANVNGIMVNI